MPALILLAGVPIARVWSAWAEGRRRVAGAGALAVCAALAVPHLLGYGPRLDLVHYNLGRLAEQRGEPEEAARQYRAAIAANPRDYLSLMSLGTLAGRRGDPAAAVGFYRRAVEIEPDVAGGLDQPGRGAPGHRPAGRGGRGALPGAGSRPVRRPGSPRPLPGAGGRGTDRRRPRASTGACSSSLRGCRRPSGSAGGSPEARAARVEIFGRGRAAASDRPGRRTLESPSHVRNHPPGRRQPVHLPGVLLPPRLDHRSAGRARQRGLRLRRVPDQAGGDGGPDPPRPGVRPQPDDQLPQRDLPGVQGGAGAAAARARGADRRLRRAGGGVRCGGLHRPALRGGRPDRHPVRPARRRASTAR